MNTAALSVGIVLDGSPPHWAAGTVPETGSPPRLTPAALIETVVGPALTGRPIVDLIPLCDTLDSLEELVLYEEVVPPDPAKGRAISRRAFFTGQLTATPEETVRQVSRRLPLPAELRWTASIALLGAAAAAQGMTAAELAAERFSLPLPPAAPPLHQELDWGDPRPEPDGGTSSFGLTPPPGPVNKVLGGSGERLQALVRSTAESLAQHGHQSAPTIHLSLNGSLGALFDGNVGKMLGALYGLERAAGACRLRVEDPLPLEDLGDQLAKLAELGETLRFRKMGLQLAAAAGIDSLEALTETAASKTVGAIRLPMGRLGSFPRLIEAAAICRDAGIELLLAPDAQGSEAEAQLGALLQPAALFTGDRHRCRQQMAQLFSWLSSKP